MKASRLIFTLLLASSVAVVQLAGQQTKADQKPIEEVKAKAEAGDAESQVELGLRYLKGEGVTKDQVEAVKWFRKAAEQNFARGQYDLGVCFYAGEGVAKDQVEAVKWYRKAAEQNYAKAQYNLGVCYYNGEGVAKDQVEAVKWVRKAAGQNDAAAQYNLGVFYYNGEGVAKDQVEAVKWYRKAAEQNDADAQRELGVCYQKGAGVEQDHAEAVKWYRKAAEQNNADAQNSLESMAGTETVMATIEGKDGYTLSGETECGGETTSTIKPGERFIARELSHAQLLSLGLEGYWEVYLKSGISGNIPRNRIRLLPDEPLAKLNYESCKKEWRKLQSKPIKKTDDVAYSAKKYHGVANYYKTLVQASEGNAKAFRQFNSLGHMDGAAGEGHEETIWVLLHVSGDDTFAKLLAGQSSNFRVGYGEVLAGEGFPISNPKPYIKLHFPKTYAILYSR
jgi:TPR repeat protein